MAAVFMLPYYLLRSYRRGKYRDGIAERFGHYRESLLLALKGVPFIWVHAVSVGETRAAIPLIKALRKRYPDHKILVSNVTETGHQIASSSQWIDHTIYFPVRFSMGYPQSFFSTEAGDDRYCRNRTVAKLYPLCP